MKKISEMTPDEALTEQALAVFKRRLEQARKKAVESAAATKAVFDALEDMCIDPDEIPSAAENAENLEEAICCFIDYGEYSVSGITHTVKDHTHAIEFGIYEGQRASKATIKVDGKEIPAPSSYSNIDIVEYLATDSNGKIRRNSWHSIEILPDNMSRIVGAVFAQTFCNSRGGGDY